MKKILVIFLLGLGFLNEMQSQVPWSVSGTRTRFTKGLGIPVGDTSMGGAADTAQLLIRRADGRLYVKYQYGWQLAIGDFVPYTGANTNVVIGDYRVSARTFLNDSILARTSAGAKLLSNSGSVVAEYGVGGGDNMDFHGFAGYNANRSSSYTARSFTDKNYVDSGLTARLLGYVDITTNQTGIAGNKSFTNNITANSFITSSGTSSQLVQGDGSLLTKTDIHSGAFTFDTTGRLLTIPVLGGGSYSVLIPRGTASGAEGITALTSSRTGNLITVFGDNGSSTTFSARDADSANAMLYSDSAGLVAPYRRTSTKITNLDLANSTISGISLGSNLASLTAGYGLSGTAYNGSTGYTWLVDTSAISTKANVVALLLGYATNAGLATKLNISDTATAFDNFRRKTTLIENADLRNSAITINGSSTSLGGSISVGTVTSVAASAGTGISVSGSPITSSGTITITNTAPDQVVSLSAGTGISVSGTYPNFTVTNTSPSGGGTVTSVGLSAPTGFSVSGSPITSSGTLALGFTAGYSLPTTASQALWDIAYNKRIVSASLSSSQLTLTAGDASTVTASVPTFNQNTTGTAASLSAVLSSSLGGAGSVSGILKANGLGVVSAAVAGDITSLISGTYLPLTAGSGNKITGELWQEQAGAANIVTKNTTGGTDLKFVRLRNLGSNFYIEGINDAFSAVTKQWNFNMSDGSTTLPAALSGTSLSMSGLGEYGGTIRITGATGGLATGSGVEIRNNSGTGEIFTYNRATAAYLPTRIDGSTLALNTLTSGAITLGGSLSGTSLSMSGAGSFGGALTVTGLTTLNDLLTINTPTSSYIQYKVSGTTYGYSGVAYTTNSIVTGSVLGDMVHRTVSKDFLVSTNDGSSVAFRLAAGTGVATFSSALSGTSLSMSGGGLFNGAVDDGTNKLIVNGGVKVTTGNIRIDAEDTYVGTDATTVPRLGFVKKSGAQPFIAFSADPFKIKVSSGSTIDASNTFTDVLTIANTGAATFSSSVTANSFVKSGGTSSQFLKADGSVDGNTYVNTSSTQSVGGNKTFTSSTVFTGVRFAYSSVSSNYTLTDNDDYVVVTNASTITLPTAVGRAGKRYVLRSTAGSGVSSSLTSTSGQTVDGIIGPFSFGFGNYNILIVFSDGANWFSETFITGG